MIAYASHSIGTAGMILAFAMLFLILAVVCCIRTDRSDQTGYRRPPDDDLRP